jgi:hypothetical protein
VSTYGCKKKSKFLRKKNNKSAILPFFTVNAVATQQAQTQSAPPKPMPTAPMPKAEEVPAPPKKTTIINSDNKGKLSKLLLGRNAGAEDNNAQNQNLRNNTFTAEQLGASWLTFSKRIPQLPDIHYIFSKEPEINGTEVKVTVTSSIVEHKLQENMELLKQHLCNDVKNDYINVVINLDKSAANNLSLTAKEKARLMNEKNPHLMTMFKEWKLKLY